MRLLWLGNTTPPCACMWYRLDAVPSLVALALQQQDRPTFDAVILDCRQLCPYSPAHILSASSFFRLANIRLCLFGGGQIVKTDAWLLHCDGDIALALDFLQRGEATNRPTKSKAQAAQTAKQIQKPPGTMLIVEVLGSQARIGCTTQCLQLFHYLTSAGFTPAVIVTQEHRMLLQQLMGGKNIGDAVIIDSIPFLLSVHSGYDCFIRDGGCIDKGKAERAQTADICVLVAGTKPWELSHSASALALLRSVSRLATVVTFAEDGQVLMTLLQKLGLSCPVLTAPWQPSPFLRGKEEVYEPLRPLVEQMILEEL